MQRIKACFRGSTDLKEKNHAPAAPDANAPTGTNRVTQAPARMPLKRLSPLPDSGRLPPPGPPNPRMRLYPFKPTLAQRLAGMLWEPPDDESLFFRIPPSPADTIAELMQAVPPRGMDGKPSIRTIMWNSRPMTPEAALCYAMELAIEHRPEDMPQVARRLFNRFPVEPAQFRLFGLPFRRERVHGWALGRGLPNKGPFEEAELAAMTGEMYVAGNGQNVHASAVTDGLGKQLLKMRSRITRPVDIIRALAEIRQYLSQPPRDSLAIAGLNRAMLFTDFVEKFGNNLPGAITCIWNYIRSVDDKNLQDQLKGSFRDKLHEIEVEGPCGMGMLGRLCDTPTAIDWSISGGFCMNHLRDELQTMAAAVNEEFENEHEEMLDAVRDAGTGANRMRIPEAVLTAQKREQFLQKAFVELALFRQISPKVVAAEAERIFPEGAIF